MRKPSIGVICGVIALSIALIVRPWIAHQTETLQAWQAVWPRLQLWREAQAKAAQHATRQAVAADQFSALVERRVAASGLAVYWEGMPTMQSDRLTFRFKAVPFDQAITWLEHLLQQYKVRVIKWHVERRAQLGRVDMQLTLGRVD